MTTQTQQDDLPLCVPQAKVGDTVRLKRPWRIFYRGKLRVYRVARVVEVMAVPAGRLYGLKFSTYPNVVDLGHSLVESSRPGR